MPMAVSWNKMIFRMICRQIFKLLLNPFVWEVLSSADTTNQQNSHPSIRTLIHNHSGSFFLWISPRLDTFTNFPPFSCSNHPVTRALSTSVIETERTRSPKKSFHGNFFFFLEKIEIFVEKIFFHFLLHQAPSEHL